MPSFIIWIAYALGVIFFVGCVVAWWEHLGRARRPGEEIDWESPAPKAVSVDVSLDTLTAPGNDVGERRRALGGAMARMTERRGGGRTAESWVDTTPMILPSAATPSDSVEEPRKDAAETQQ